jgi:hypothetical protein
MIGQDLVGHILPVHYYILDSLAKRNDNMIRARTKKAITYVIALNRSSPYGNRTRVTRMKIWCPNP